MSPTLKSKPSHFLPPLCYLSLMGHPGWMSGDEKEFVNGLRILALSHQRTRTLQEFWTHLHRVWFAQFPSREPEQKDLDEARREVEGLEHMASDLAEEHMVFISTWS